MNYIIILKIFNKNKYKYYKIIYYNNIIFMNNIYLSNSIKYLTISFNNLFINFFLFIFRAYCLFSILLYILINNNVKNSSILSVLSTFLRIYVKFKNVSVGFDKESLIFKNKIINRTVGRYDKIIIYSEINSINDLIPIIDFCNNNLFFIKHLDTSNIGVIRKNIFEKINEISLNELKFIKNHFIKVFIVEDVRLIQKKIFNKNEYVFIIIKDILESKIPFYFIKHVN